MNTNHINIDGTTNSLKQKFSYTVWDYIQKHSPMNSALFHGSLSH